MSCPAGPGGSQRETSSAPGNVGTLRVGRRACREGLIFLTHRRPHACVRHRGCDQGPCFVPTKMEVLWGGHSSQGFAVALSAADPFFLSWLRGCSPPQTWGRGGGVQRQSQFSFCKCASGRPKTREHKGLCGSPSLPLWVKQTPSCNTPAKGGLSPRARETDRLILGF